MSIRILSAVVALALLAFGQPTQAASPSFDCAKAATPVEKLLCSDDGLARRDRLLAVTYRKALGELTDGAAADLRAAQRAWARGRAAACPDVATDPARAVACLADLYDARIAAIRPLSFSELALQPGVNVQSDRRTPLACLKFDAPLLPRQAAALDSYVESSAGETLAARVVGDELCVEGLAHGGEHRLTVKAGLRAEGAELRDDVTVAFDIPNRPRRVAFPSSGLILPRIDAAGLPIEAVNMDAARVLVLRIDDADLIDGLRRGLVERQISYADVGHIASKLGHNVWTGEVEFGGRPNNATRVAIPIREVASNLRPGVYLAVAEDPQSEVGQEWWATSQWFVISDIGLTAFAGEDGLTVAARRLSAATPVQGTRIALIAEDGSTLTSADTDVDGLTRLAPGYLRGEGDKAAKAVYAYGAAGDFVYLDLGRAPFDLSDRGVDGREAPGALDAYLTTERGVYRPGESVQLTALLRNAAAKAIEGLPLTVKLVRDDGLEIYRRMLTDKGDGGYADRFNLPPTAATGMWRATAHVNPNGPAVGRTQFLVEDFVPPRLESEMTATLAGGRVTAALKADYLYGAPAAGLGGEASLTVRPVQNPPEALAAYSFGLVQEEAPTPNRAATERFATDDGGEARIVLDVGQVPPTSYPMEAEVRAELFDVGGRPVAAVSTVPLQNLPLMVGLRPLFADAQIAEGGTAAFEVAAFDPTGAPVARDIEYVILREEIEYLWYQDGGRWDYRVQYLDGEVVDSGVVRAGADAPARIERRFDRWGGYRVEATDPETGVASSVRFHAGWWGASAAVDEPQPDKVKVTLPAGPFAPGDTVTAVIEPPFDAEVMASVVDNRLREIKTAAIPAGGGEMTLTLPADGAGGVYILVNAYGKALGERSRAPRRAIGAAWAAFDGASKSLDVSIGAAAETLPEQSIDVRVDVGSANGAAYVTLAAVDDGVLQLTDYQAPDPKAYYLGKRRLGVELRDVYGRFIDAAGATLARVRSGGDEAMKTNMALADLPKKSSRVVALFSGVVETDADGAALIPLDIPEFSGRLRLMAQAWTATKVGAAETTMLVRRSSRPWVCRVSWRPATPRRRRSRSATCPARQGPTRRSSRRRASCLPRQRHC